MSRVFRFKTSTDPLTIADHTLEPDLGINAESVDAVTWRVTIRPDARFQNIPPVNGHAVEAEDVEVWSPSTGEYDVETKLQEYQRRGDLEIWRIHPYERTLTAWRRQSEGTYAEFLYHGGTVQPAALPNITIDLESLFPRRPGHV